MDVPNATTPVHGSTSPATREANKHRRIALLRRSIMDVMGTCDIDNKTWQFVVRCIDALSPIHFADPVSMFCMRFVVVNDRVVTYLGVHDTTYAPNALPHVCIPSPQAHLATAFIGGMCHTRRVARNVYDLDWATLRDVLACTMREIPDAFTVPAFIDVCAVHGINP